MKKCFLCECDCIVTEHSNQDIRYKCDNCGDYYVFATKSTKKLISDNKNIVAGFCFETNRKKNDNLTLKLSQNKVKSILQDVRIPKTIMQKLDKILIHHYKLGLEFGQPCYLLHWTCSYAKSYNEYWSMQSALQDLGFYDGAKLTLKGIERAEQLISTNIDSKNVFVAMQFSGELLKNVHEKAIKPACDSCGFNAMRIDENPHNNGITDQIMVDIKRSKFVIVDFTYNNNGAYWEAGYAQGLGRTVIRCCNKEWFNKNGLHFDIRHYNTILWESHEDLTKQLKSNIRANIDGAKLEDATELFTNPSTGGE